MNLLNRLARPLAALCLLATALSATANEAAIRKNLAERLPNLPRIDEVRATPMKGLFEVRINQSDLLYTDAEGKFLIQGNLLDIENNIDLTEQRIEKLTTISFKDLPLNDAIKSIKGDGKLKIAVFSDPNCGFCKRLEKDLEKATNITVYTFLIPILSKDSQEKTANIWCSKNKSQAYLDWMLKGIIPPQTNCDVDAIQRNMAFASKHRITGTPTTFLENGSRVIGADIKRILQ